MSRSSLHATLVVLAAASLAGPPRAVAQTTMPSPVTPAAMYKTAKASLVVVHYIWASELGPKEIEIPGVVIDGSGVVMCSAAVVNDAVPLKQITDVKFIVPRVGDAKLELAAEFQGRDDRCDLAFFKAQAKHDWTPLTFTPASPAAGDTIFAVGLLGKANAYAAVITRSMVSAVMEQGPQAMTDGGLPGIGAIVFDASGRAIGYASASMQPGGRRGNAPPQQPSTFVPAEAFVAELADRPTPQRPVIPPWMGVVDWNGLKPDEAAYYGITTPAIHIGGVTPGGSLERAGIKPGQIIVGVNGQPLKRGGDTDSIAGLFRQNIIHKKPGDVVQFSVVDGKGAKPHDVAVTLDPVPAMANTAERFFAEDLGLGVRDAVYLDRFGRRLPSDAAGVVVTLVRPGGPAEAARLPADAFVKEVGGTPVANVTAFADSLRKQRRDKPGEPIVLLINQGGRDATIRIESN